MPAETRVTADRRRELQTRARVAAKSAIALSLTVGRIEDVGIRPWLDGEHRKRVRAVESGHIAESGAHETRGEWRRLIGVIGCEGGKLLIETSLDVVDSIEKR